MIKTSTDVSLVIAQLVSWSGLLLLSDFAAVITVPYLIAIVVIGIALLMVSYIQLGSQSYSSLTRPKESNAKRCAAKQIVEWQYFIAERFL